MRAWAEDDRGDDDDFFTTFFCLLRDVYLG